MGLFETGSVWGWLCVEIRLSLMGLFEARMNGEWVPEDQWIIFNGLLLVASIEKWRWKQGKTGFRRSMDYLRWAFVGSKHRRMTLEARENELQKKKGQSSMDYCWWKVSKNGDEIDRKRAFTLCGVCGNNPKPLRADARGRA
ncbi:hypothetical protein [Alloprevotella tannerae]|uniref:hypothetical protein n=1 Tax=Alloprevotella tannerae TaxID=76122 RepID=UPI00288A5DFF|nr:hypothetical protein [Alloprevotella tannerae]